MANERAFGQTFAASRGTSNALDISRLSLDGPPLFDIRNLGCQSGNSPNVNNAALINAALAKAPNRYNLYWPPGTWVITESIRMPGRTGFRMLGAGMSKNLTDGSYDGGPRAIAGAVTRVLWRGNHLDPMIRYDGLGAVIEGFHFQGRPVPSGGKPYYEPPPKQITGVTNDLRNRIIITSPMHGLLTGSAVVVSGVEGYSAANGTWAVVSLTPNTFMLKGSEARGKYTGGGAWVYAKARIGIHVRPSSVHGGINTGKLAVRDCSFWQVKTDFLFGRDMSSDKVSGGRYAHYKDNNADESLFDNLLFFKSPVAAAERDEDTCFRFRNEQAVGFHVNSITVWGGSYVFWFENGGKLVADKVSLVSVNNTLLRLSYPDFRGGYYKIAFHIDQGSLSNSSKLLKMDRHPFYAYVDLTGKMPAPYMSDMEPVVDAKGACKIVLRVDGLQPGSIRMTGGAKNPVHGRIPIANVNLDNCTFTNRAKSGGHTVLPADLIAPASSGHYRMTWHDCATLLGSHVGEKEVFEMLPIMDGSITSAGKNLFTPLVDPKADK